MLRSHPDCAIFILRYATNGTLFKNRMMQKLNAFCYMVVNHYTPGLATHPNFACAALLKHAPHHPIIVIFSWRGYRKPDTFKVKIIIVGVNALAPGSRQNITVV